MTSARAGRVTRPAVGWTWVVLAGRACRTACETVDRPSQRSRFGRLIVEGKQDRVCSSTMSGVQSCAATLNRSSFCSSLQP
jgi:hypothetical protein